MAFQFRTVAKILIITVLLNSVSFAFCCCSGRIYSTEDSIQAKINTVLQKDIMNTQKLNFLYQMKLRKENKTANNLKLLNTVFADSKGNGYLLKLKQMIFNIKKTDKLKTLEVK